MVVPAAMLGIALYRLKRMKVLQSNVNQTTIWIHWFIAALAIPSYCLGSFETSDNLSLFVV